MSSEEKGVVRSAAASVFRASVMNGAFDPRRAAGVLRSFGWFTRDFLQFRKQSSRASLTPRLRDLAPMLMDRSELAGIAGGDYFCQDLWAARKIYARRPSDHLDIGSRIDGFIAHLLVFMPVRVVDIRPMHSNVDGLSFEQDDATELRRIGDGTVDSLSCLHAAEHFGLGRYGDPIDPDACFGLMRALSRVLKQGGRLYFSVPIGQERVLFNAQRIFSPLTIVEEMKPLQLLEMSMVDNRGDLVKDVSPAEAVEAGGQLGLFEFTKASPA